MLSSRYIDAMERLFGTDPTMKPRYCRDALIQYLILDVTCLLSDFRGEAQMQVKFSAFKLSRPSVVV